MQPELARQPEIIQGLRNLIQNAVDFAASTVWIDLDWTDAELRVAIGDDGPGYPPDLIGRIGDPFLGRRAAGRLTARPSGPATTAWASASSSPRRCSSAPAPASASATARRTTRAVPPEFARPTGAIVTVTWPRAGVSRPAVEPAGRRVKPSLNLPASDGPALLARVRRHGCVAPFPFAWPVLDLPEGALAALVSAVATLALAAILGPRLSFARAGRPAAAAPGGSACDFLINGASLKALTEPARALLDGLPAGGPRLAALAAHYAADCPTLRGDLEALVLYGAGFRHHCPRGDGTAYEIVGEPRGGAAWLSIRPASEEARALADAEAALARAGGELRFLRDVLDRAPVMAWSKAPDGQVVWANAAYRDRFDAPAGELPDHRIANAFGQVLEEVPLTPRGPGSRRRVAVAGRDDAEPRWYELSESPGAAGETVGFALDADDLVAAEASLRRFVETLTETFAHLPIGLAVFDKNRRLGLFNPALTDLVKIDAVWLAGRPSLRDFLERLRETRQMPEQKDFASWRRKLGELEEGARDGTYEENWQLPSGKIFRVTGRPHPQGALAFLFEDISSAIILERKYRSELELSQATLDRMSEAVAVFDASGMLVFVNSAFETPLGPRPDGAAERPRRRRDVRALGRALRPLAGLGAARRVRHRRRGAHQLDRRRRHPRRRQPAHAGRAAPRHLGARRLPRPRRRGGRHRPARPRPGPRRRRRRPRLRAAPAPRRGGGAEARRRHPRRASRRAPSRRSARRWPGLKDGLARARELRALAGAAAATGPLPELAAALAARGLTLACPPDAAAWPPDLRRAALALGLAAADLAAPGAGVTLDLATADGRRRLTARAAADPGARPSAEGVAAALARRVVEAAGGSLKLASADGAATLAADLPAPRGADDAPRDVARRA